jgi:hypothetical protein
LSYFQGLFHSYPYTLGTPQARDIEDQHGAELFLSSSFTDAVNFHHVVVLGFPSPSLSIRVAIFMVTCKKQWSQEKMSQTVCMRVGFCILASYSNPDFPYNINY